MARRRRRNVYGEPVEVLLSALTAVASADVQDPAALLSEAEIDALVRASMRCEAALLRRDADRYPELHRPNAERRSSVLPVLAAGVVEAADRLGIDRTRATVTQDQSPPCARTVRDVS